MGTSNFNIRQKCSMCWKSDFLVVLAAFVVNFCIMGFYKSDAVIYKALMDAFETNRQYAAWPSGVNSFCLSITAVVSGILANYWSIRSLSIIGTILASMSVSACSLAPQMQYIILLYGAIQGIGIGLVFPHIYVVLNQNFTKYRSFVIGIASTGISFGMFALPQIENYFLTVYDLNGTFLLIGGVLLNSLAGAMLFKSPQKLQLQNENCDKNSSDCQSSEDFQYKEQDNPENYANVIIKYDKKKIDVKKSDMKSNVSRNEFEEQPSKATVFSRIYSNFRKRKNILLAMEILTSPHFLIIAAAYASYFMSVNIFITTILDFAIDRDIKVDDGLFLVSAYSFGDLAGRLTTGWIADLQFVRRSTLVRLYLIALGIMLIILPKLSYNGIAAVTVALGIISGGISVNYSVVFNEYLGLQKLPMTMGFSTCINGMLAFLRPIIIGFFRDYHQSYEMLLVFLGIIHISIGSLWFLELIIPVLRKHCFVNKTVQ